MADGLEFKKSILGNHFDQKTGKRIGYCRPDARSGMDSELEWQERFCDFQDGIIACIDVSGRILEPVWEVRESGFLHLGSLPEDRSGRTGKKSTNLLAFIRIDLRRKDCQSSDRRSTFLSLESKVETDPTLGSVKY